MRKAYIFFGWVTMLIALAIAPSFIPIGNDTLMAWQREHIGWNYIGVSANFVLFFTYVFLSKKPFKHFGITFKRVNNHAGFIILLACLLVGFVLLSNLFSEGPLTVHFPGWSTIIFQLLFISSGEELFWRGFIQTEYTMWIASIGFGMMHFVPDVLLYMFTTAEFHVVSSFTHLIFATMLGLLFGWVRLKTGSVFPAILLHGLYGLSNHLFISGM